MITVYPDINSTARKDGERFRPYSALRCELRGSPLITRMKRLLLPLLLFIVFSSLPATLAHAEPRCFADAAITDCIDGRIRQFWEDQGGLTVFGYPLTPAYPEQTAAGREFPPQTGAPAEDIAPETGYAVDARFAPFYQAIGGAWRLGPPMSGLLIENNNGAPTEMQYFVNGRLEWNAAAGVVEVGRLGSWALEIQCRYGQ